MRASTASLIVPAKFPDGMTITSKSLKLARASELVRTAVTPRPNLRSSENRVQPADSVCVGVSHTSRTFGFLSAATSLLPSDVPSSTHEESIGTSSAPCLSASAASLALRSAAFSAVRMNAVPIG